MHDKIKELVGRYLDGQSSVQDLESWLATNLQEILDSQDEQTIELADQICADLVMLSESLLNQLDFDNHLAGYLGASQIFRFTLGGIDTETYTRSSSRTSFVLFNQQAAA